MSGLIFDGHSFDELFYYGNPELTILSSNAKYAQSENRNGSLFIGKTWANSQVTFSIATTGTADERRNAFSTLGMWLDVDEPKKLVLPDTPDRYYMAVPNGSLDITRYYDSETASITFDIVDPIAYGREVTITVPSAGSVTFNVGGTYKTRPRISATATRDSTSLVYGLKLDDVDYIHVATGSADPRTVGIDCEKRTCIVNSSVSMITLDSNWLELAPGGHTLAMDNGTGDATVTYFERWL